MLLFERFNFTLTYCPGSRNLKPDALSRQFAPDSPEGYSGLIPPPSCVVGVIRWQVKERVREALNSVFSARGTCSSLTPSAPRSSNGDTNPSSPASSKPYTSRDVRRHAGLHCCLPALGSREGFASTGLLKPLPIPRRPWSHLTGLPSNDHSVILTILDRFSKCEQYVPFPKLPSAVETAALLIQHVFPTAPEPG